ncbi:hypothetical protein H0H92_005548 [Tricholoma furcatifolium]|nr:hypothetical protein H0H92_005548 [Tricholoma furcatifolium]
MAALVLSLDFDSADSRLSRPLPRPPPSIEYRVRVSGLKLKLKLKMRVSTSFRLRRALHTHSHSLHAPLHPPAPLPLPLDPKTCRARIEALDGRVNAFVRTRGYVGDGEGMATATALTTGNESGKGKGKGKLEGWTVAVKDSICTRDMKTGCASRMLAEFDPGYDADVVRLLRAQGADIIGKTNCDEFGMGSMNTHSVHGPVLNPRWASEAEARVAGGSSGGSAAAVAAGMCRVALGTDTGGSTRLPASYCGVVGLKPSYGLLSRWGVVSFADSLDCVGVFGRSVEDVREVFRVLDVHCAKDPTSAGEDARGEARARARRRVGEVVSGDGRLDGLRVGVPQEYFPAELREDVVESIRRVLQGLKDRGATIVPVSMPNTEYALSAYYVLASAEASSNLARYDGVEYGLNVRPLDTHGKSTGQIYASTRSAGFGAEVKRRILLGTYALSAAGFDSYFLQAQRVRELVRSDFHSVFSSVDVLVHGCGVQDAPKLGSGLGIDGYVQDVLTVPASLAGMAALSVGGVQMVAKWGYDELLLSII